MTANIRKHLEKIIGASITVEGAIIWPNTCAAKYQAEGKIRRSVWESDIARLAFLVGGKTLETVVLLPPHIDIERLGKFNTGA